MATHPQLSEPELVALRDIEPSSLAPLLAHERGRWSSELGWDFRPTESLLLRGIGKHGLDGFAYRDGGEILAYVYTISAPARSHIGGAHRLPGSERAGVDLALLIEHAIVHLAEVEGTGRIESQLFKLGQDDPALAFARHGFRHYPREFLSAELGPLRARLGSGPVFPTRPLTTRDRQRVAALIQDGFVDSIDAEISACYRTRDGSQSFVDGVIDRHGCGLFDTSASALTAGDIDRGCVLSSQIGPEVGHIVQLSVARAAQGQGHGTNLLRTAAESFQSRGFSSLTLSVSTANRAAHEWYRRLGFTRIREFGAWTWQR